MFKYLLLCLGLLMPIKLPQPRAFRAFASCNSQIVAMVPPPGIATSKNHEGNQLPEEGCEINSEVVHHNNGGTTEIVSVTFTKKIKRDKSGNIVKETDTSQPRYQKVRDIFFRSSLSKSFS